MRPETHKQFNDALHVAVMAEELTQPDPTKIREDVVLCLAVERLLMTVGEALSRVRHDEPNLLLRLTNPNAIIGLRNVLVHGYDSVDVNRLVASLQEDLPLLIQELRELL
jgi:uncharacterized protein with HEPN domain